MNPVSKSYIFHKVVMSRVCLVIFSLKHLQIRNQLVVLVSTISFDLRRKYRLGVFPVRYRGYLPYQKTILKSSRCGSHPQYLNHAVYPSRKCNKFQKVVISRVDGVVGVQHFWIRNQEIVLVSSIFFEVMARMSARGLASLTLGLARVSKIGPQRFHMRVASKIP